MAGLVAESVLRRDPKLISLLSCFSRPGLAVYLHPATYNVKAGEGELFSSAPTIKDSLSGISLLDGAAVQMQ